jgi:uncharacterized protein
MTGPGLLSKSSLTPSSPLQWKVVLKPNLWLVLSVALMGCSPAVGPESVLQGQLAEGTLPDGYRVASEEQLSGEWTNRLVEETSPYLLQHAHNPVDWFAWGDAAFEEAKRRDVPVFLSVGYAACHWCHVMEEESFMDPKTAAYLNGNFVCVKVDREERPDVDAVYMDAVYELNRSGGWPASIWMTDDRQPFYAGTYYPKEPRHGRPSFRQVLEEITDNWRNDRQSIHSRADIITGKIASQAAIPPEANYPLDAPQQGLSQLLRTWDAVHFGWGRKKFPMLSRLEFLLAFAQDGDRSQALALVDQALNAMDRGGIHDQVGGGFHRYTVDPAWVVPHFEKMLYDNGQFIRIYAEAAVVLKRPRYGDVVDEVVRYLEREMRHEGGAFYSSQDADSGGEEGTYYVWTPAQVNTLLGGPEAAAVNQAYQITAQGNFEHRRTVLTRPDAKAGRGDLVAARALMLAERAERVAPPTDTKRVVAYNGLTISGLARSARLLGRENHLKLAQDAARAVLAARSADGSLPRTLEPRSPGGVLDDYAYLIEGLLDLYEADFNLEWLVAADQLALVMVNRFEDPVSGGFFYSDPGATELLARQKEISDGARPSGYGRALQSLARLDAYGADSANPQQLQRGLEGAGRYLSRGASSVPSLLTLVQAIQRPGMQVVIAVPAGARDRAKPFLAAYNARYRPMDVVAVVDGSPGEDRFQALKGKTSAGEQAQAYVCFDGVCKQPVTDVADFELAMAQRVDP